MENTNIATGALVVNNPFALEISGAISFGMLSPSGALIACNSGAVFRWVELKKE